jgi:hypothetical protein
MLIQEDKITKENGGSIWEKWKVSEAQKSFSNITQQVREMQEDHREGGKINFKFNQNLTIIFHSHISVLKYCTFGPGTGNKTT